MSDGRNISLHIPDWVDEVLGELCDSFPMLSQRDVLDRIVTYVAGSSTVTRQAFLDLFLELEARRRGKCGGPGVGRDSASDTIKGRCPSKVDCEKKLDELEEIAKRRARKMANEGCQLRGGADCLSTGGTYKVLIRDCVQRRDLDNNPRCDYRVVVRYSGTCTTVA